MSEVLIKGVKIPRTCDMCWALDDYGDYPRCRITGEQRGYNFPFREKRMDKCPLISVPTQHGRLIDADAFDERVRVAGGMSEEELTEDFKDGVQTVLYMLSKQPPIIEGSKT